MGGDFNNGWVTGYVRELAGRYEIAYDDQPPAVTPLSLTGDRLRLSVTDDKSGIASWTASVDGRFIVFDAIEKSTPTPANCAKAGCTRRGRRTACVSRWPTTVRTHKSTKQHLPINMKRQILLSLAFVAAVGSMACTNFIVGKKASADGSVICSYNADSYGAFMHLYHYPAAKHQPGEMRKIYEWDTNKYLGEIPEAAETYNVIGNINECR